MDRVKHALLVVLGSVGDLHPFLGVGLKLRERGHRVTLLAASFHRKSIEKYGFEYAQLGPDRWQESLIERTNIRRPVQGAKLLANGLMLTAMRPAYEYIVKHHVPGQTVVLANPMTLGARLAQETHGVPLISIVLAPGGFHSVVRPAQRSPSPRFHSLPRWANVLFDWLYCRISDGLIGPGLNAFRAELGLPPISRIVHWMSSPQKILGLFPDWYCPPASDWPRQSELLGFPLFDGETGEGLPADVEAFLAGGDPPILFTPGSPHAHADYFFRSAVEACRRLGKRGLFLSHHSGHIPKGLPPEIGFFGYVPLSRLLPRAAAIVHHAGIGTSSLSIAAGVPQLLVPWGVDQFEIAYHLVKIGVGRRLSTKECDGPRLTLALGALLTSGDVRTSCARYQERIRQDSGCAGVAAAVEEFVKGSGAQLVAGADEPRRPEKQPQRQ